MSEDPANWAGSSTTESSVLESSPGVEEALRRKYLDAMGIQVWEQRGEPPVRIEDEADADKTTIEKIQVRSEGPSAEKISQMDWDELQQKVVSCAACDLHASRTQAIFGVGSRQADLLIIGEAPGADEDRQGEPFVGRAGKLLNEMLFAIGLDRKEVYIANILKCRPPNNRDPQATEVFSCEPYLRRQVLLLQPKMMLAVGRIAAQNLLKTETSIGKLRGKQYQYPDTEIPVIVTYHPAYLLRSPMEKRKVWQDLLSVRDWLNHDGHSRK